MNQNKGRQKDSSFSTSDYMTWAKNLQLFIYNTLAVIIPDAETRRKYVNKEAMKVWIRAFTHLSYDHQNNYDILEHLGDKVLHAVFAKYLIQKYPILTEANYTALQSHYMSGITQSVIFSRKLNLFQYIRIFPGAEITTKIRGDVFEAFFGALETVADMVTPGIGFAVCYNMLYYIFQDENIDLSVAGQEQPITLVDQIFHASRLGFERIKNPSSEEIVKTDGKFRYFFTITDKTKENLAKYGKNLDTIVGEGFANTKEESKLKAAKNTLDNLKALGITPEWVEKLKQQKEQEELQKAPSYKEALKKAKKEKSVVSIAIEKVPKMETEKYTTIFLMGFDTKGNKYSLAMLQKPRGHQQDNAVITEEILERYLE